MIGEQARALILDTSVLLAFLDRDDPAHVRVTDLINSSTALLVVSPLVLAELDYLLLTRGRVDAELAGMRELTSGAWEVAEFTKEDLADALAIVERYRSIAIGATDASLVVLAARHRTRTIATLDRRHFEFVRSLDGRPFEVVPGA